MEKISGIYCIENLINCKKYVGKSNNIYKRWQEEKSGLKGKYFHNIHLQRAWDKYKEDSFKFYIVEICDESMLMEREQYWIKEFDSYKNGYNQTFGGEGALGVVCSDEKRQKIREAHMGHKNFNTRAVYCPELNQIFWGAKEAQNLYKDKYKVRANGVCQCCKGVQTYCGKLSDGTRLHWCYLEDKDLFITPIQQRETPVYCVELNEVFINACIAEKDQRILNAHSVNILACCKGDSHHKTCGKLTDGTKLTWKYAQKEELNNLLNVA